MVNLRLLTASAADYATPAAGGYAFVPIGASALGTSERKREVCAPYKQLLPEAPVGHRQPRADQVPSENNLMGDPNDPINRENAELDRMVKGICRGC
jgi:hypothetical protein